jgi:hypothetical protein
MKLSDQKFFEISNFLSYYIKNNKLNKRQDMKEKCLHTCN